MIPSSESFPCHSNHAVTHDAVPDFPADADAVAVVIQTVLFSEQHDIVIPLALTAAVDISKIILFFQ